jgi:pimeloyl-ACP methyl ester carboxylesterase
MPAMTTLLLLHGGLWEDGMDAERFWATPGIITGLQRHGLQVLAPDRPSRPPSWAAEADQLAPTLPQRPVTLVAGSNGCSVAVRLALARPDRIERLLLAWPATARDPTVDARVRSDLGELGACPRVIDELLAGQTLRGITDAELGTLQMPVGVLPSVPENPLHQRRTVQALLRLAQHAKELPGCPEPPRPGFPPHLERFLTAVTQFATS